MFKYRYMKKIIIILLLLIIFLFTRKESFSNVLESNVYHNVDNLAPWNIDAIKFESELTKEELDNNRECCLVERIYGPDLRSIYGANFSYKYSPLKGIQCNRKLHNINHTKQLFMVGENGWTNDKCQVNKLGSCRLNNKECVDFMDKKTCTDYRMIWSDLTCANQLPYTWNNRNAISRPEASTQTVIDFSNY